MAGSDGTPAQPVSTGQTADPDGARPERSTEARARREREEERSLARLARAIVPSSLGDIGLEIPWRQRLSTKLFAMTGLVAFAAVAAFFFAEIAVQRHLFSQLVEESALVSHTIRNSLHRAMLQDRRSDAYAIAEDIAREPGIERIRMMDDGGRITFSTEASEVGGMVDRRAEACFGCHAQGAPLGHLDRPGRNRIHWSGDHRVLGIVTPLYNEPSCSTAACHAHPSSQSVLGVLDVGISLARLDTEMQSFRLQAAIAAATAAALLGLLVWFFARRHLTRPVAALVQATRRVARDQLELEIPVTWNGELGLLAASFNDMTRSLRHVRRELDGLMSSLEHQVEDRTEALRAAQDQLVRSERLSSLGKLSASIAHEINNPLAGILTFAKLVVRTLDEGPPDDGARQTMVKQLLLVQRETERCSAIVRSLLDFARERPLSVKDVDLSVVVEEALQLVAHQLSILGVRLEKELGNVPAVSADFGQLRQACVNVVMNACEAMGRGGQLTVRTALVEEGSWVEATFSDTGPGISPENLSRIFDPFFTTKDRGTGLGLSVVYGIVERHGGKIDIQSAVGEGTRVALRFPSRPAGDAGETPKARE